MKRATGIGGIFFKSQNPEKLYAWYEKHLGIKAKPGVGAMFRWQELDGGKREAITIWSLFPRDTKYFNPSQSSFMINYRVDNLDALLAELSREGVEIDSKRQDHDYGSFAWIMDPEGNRLELWEPPRTWPKPKPKRPKKARKKISRSR